MNQDNFESPLGARELSEAELVLIHGGGFFGDLWNGVKSVASGAADAVVNAVTHPLDTLGKIAGSSFWTQLGKILTRPPSGPFGGL